MPKNSLPIVLKTAFGEYTLERVLGEGGAGRVFGGQDDTGAPVAIKVLIQTSTDKRKRFRNETAFLLRNNHKNIVTVLDYGFSEVPGFQGPFYVMRRYDGSLRNQMQKSISPQKAFELFIQVLDGVEAAHLQGVAHRDLKPENVLVDESTQAPAIADFGVASFNKDQLLTLVETAPGQRLANFQYAAPEQRTHGRTVTITADVYALGLMLNELFTGEVPHGSNHKTIGSVAPAYAFLDEIVTKMIAQNPTERPISAQEVKLLIEKHRAEAISLQKISAIDKTVITSEEIDDQLALTAPKIIGVNWEPNTLTITLDRPVTQEWVDAFHNMGNYTSLMGSEPHRFGFQENRAIGPAREHDAQQVINYFKSWLPQTTNVYKSRLEEKNRQDEYARKERLKILKTQEELKLRINKDLKF